MNAFNFPKIDTMQGKRITHRDYWPFVGSYRLSAPIHELREKGWLIKDLPETVQTSDPTERKAHIKRYYLPNDIIRSLGTTGREFVQKVQEWERNRIAGKAATLPADETTVIDKQETDKPQDSMGGAI